MILVEVRNRRVSAIIAVSDGDCEVLECENKQTCKIAGIASNRCPAYCPLVVDAKRFARGQSTRYRVDVLSRAT